MLNQLSFNKFIINNYLIQYESLKIKFKVKFDEKILTWSADHLFIAPNTDIVLSDENLRAANCACVNPVKIIFNDWIVESLKFDE